MGILNKLFTSSSFAGAVYAPIVFDNGNDLIVAQVPSDFSEEAIEPTLDQLAENVKGRSRSGDIHIRLRKLESISNEISRPVIVGEVIKNLETNTTTLMEIDRGAE